MQGVQWEGVETIVEALLMQVRRGFTEQFRSEWLHAETGIVVYISLSILQQIAPGRVNRML